MKVSILGTGIMGAGIAKSLLREGFDVMVWNRNRDKADALAGDGAVVAGSAADAVRGADVVLTVLYDADSVIDVMEGAVDYLSPDAVWLQCSTIGIDGTARVIELAGRHSVSLVDAMMLGTKSPAENGKLVMLVSGNSALVERVAPVLDAMGSKTLFAGDKPGDATALKLACNAWIASVTALIGQSLAITSGLGLDPNLFLEAIAGGATDSPYAHVKGPAMLAGDYTTSFTVDGVMKDLGLILAGAQKAGVDDSVLTAVRSAYQVASASGRGADDMAAVFEAFRPDDPRPDDPAPA